jgi:hypothetical protein
MPLPTEQQGIVPTSVSSAGRKTFATAAVLMFAALLLSPTAALASYLPGQTLNPSCMPTDPTCVVVANTAGTFVATSTTATSTFAGNVAVSGNISVGSLSGILKAIAGVIQTALVNLSSDVTGILSITNGGTGTSTAPAFGQILVGNGSGGYLLTATSSLGIISSQWITNGPAISFASGNVGIGTSTFTNLNRGSNYGFSVADGASLFGGNAGAPDVWQTQSNTLPAQIAGASAIVANGYVYLVGTGLSEVGVFYAPFDADGSLGAWQIESNNFPTEKIYDTAVAANGYLYEMGGKDMTFTATSSVYYARLYPDGTTGAWQPEASSLPVARYEATSVAANGYVYEIGGQGGGALSTVYDARLNADGSIDSWVAATSLPEATYGATSVVGNGYVYEIGGDNGGSLVSNVYYAKLNSDGSLGAWQTGTSLPQARYGASSANFGGYVYVMGGDYSSTNQSTIYYAKLNSDGSLGAWQTASNTIPDSLEFADSVAANGYIYELGGTESVGGTTGTVNVYYASLSRTVFAGSLDLVGSASSTLNGAGTTGGSIFAGDIFSNGMLTVHGNTLLSGGLGVSGNFTFNPITSANPTVPVFTVNGAAGSPPTLTALYNGNIGIGTTTPYSRLEVWGSDTASTSPFAVVNSASTTVFAVYDDGNATYSGSIFQSSDQRLKTDISSLDASTSLADIESLNPVSYIRLDQDTGTNLGFIAQQVQQIFPELVSTTSATALTPGGTLTLNYVGLIAPMVKAIQALGAQLATLEQTVAGFAQSITSAVGNFGQVNTSQLCLTDSSGSTCYTRSQLNAALAESSQQSSGSGNTDTQSGDMSASTTPPIIQVNGDNPAIINVGDTYSDLGATITGPTADLNLGIQTFVGTTPISQAVIDTSAPTTYHIYYVVSDGEGNTSTSTRTVIVQAPQTQAASSSEQTASSTNATSTSQ